MKTAFYAIRLLNLMNQALSYIMLVAVGALVVGPLVLYSQSNITSTAMSYYDFVELENKRVSQQMTATHVQHDQPNFEIHIHIVNTGLEDIVFEYVLANGEPLPPDNMSGNCWDPVNPKTDKGYCFYDSTSGMNLKDEKHPLLVDNNIRLGITYDTAQFPPPGPEKIQLVTDAFKLFEITIP